MVFKQWGLEIRYHMVHGTYSYFKLRERKMRNCAGTFFIVSGTTKAQVNHDNNTPHWPPTNAKFDNKPLMKKGQNKRGG
jgi:hypothetical protein